MLKTLPPPAVSVALALALSAFVALDAEASASTEADTLANLPSAIFGFLRSAAVFFVAPVALAMLFWHRNLISHAHALILRVSIRASALRPAPVDEPTPLAPAKHLAQGGHIDHEVKLRMTEVHRQLRARAPELLPVFADCRAAQARLLSQARQHEEGLPEAERMLIGGLVQIETATRKLSLVLDDATKEHTFGNFVDTLEKVTGDTLDCLIALRAHAKGAPQGMQIGGEAHHA
ncbi:hypothetical protein SAMN05877809_11150 [Rhodobacter sp. JA431]|uniref:hypothetical protein n=1 Tax=Rhodobacter sp. JA431 TaxID=570013 RepID=UPI000BCE7F6E|nr:hypothetical protein [Rhodobacter sp. JA431]SOC20068.1 hypothetical protein SAMN05877809_11150 [Rhodobacter sp. JA431]